MLRVSFAALLVLAGIGCNKVQEAKIEPVTAAEAEAFAARVESAVAQCDPAVLSRLFDPEPVLRTALKASGGKERDLRILRLSVPTNQLVDGICQNAKVMPRTKRLPVKLEAGQARVMLRMLGTDRFEYLVFDVGRINGKVAAFDYTSVVSGTRLSDNVADVSARLRQDAALAQGLEQRMAEALALRNKGDLAGALAVLDGMPKSMRESRPVSAAAVQIAAEVGAADLAARQKRYEALFPGSPPNFGALIAGHRNRQDWAAYLAEIDALGQVVGGDIYLEVERGWVEKIKGNAAKARAHFDKVLAVEPIYGAHLGLLELALEAKDHAVVVQHLRGLKSLGHTLNLDLALFATFRGSPEGQAYLQQGAGTTK